MNIIYQKQLKNNLPLQLPIRTLTPQPLHALLTLRQILHSIRQHLLQIVIELTILKGTFLSPYNGKACFLIRGDFGISWSFFVLSPLFGFAICLIDGVEQGFAGSSGFDWFGLEEDGWAFGVEVLGFYLDSELVVVSIGRFGFCGSLCVFSIGGVDACVRSCSVFAHDLLRSQTDT